MSWSKFMAEQHRRQRRAEREQRKLDRREAKRAAQRQRVQERRDAQRAASSPILPTSLIEVEP
jgi:hypothetical protein